MSCVLIFAFCHESATLLRDVLVNRYASNILKSNLRVELFTQKEFIWTIVRHLEDSKSDFVVLAYRA